MSIILFFVLYTSGLTLDQSDDSASTERELRWVARDSTERRFDKVLASTERELRWVARDSTERRFA